MAGVPIRRMGWLLAIGALGTVVLAIMATGEGSMSIVGGTASAVMATASGLNSTASAGPITIAKGVFTIEGQRVPSDAKHWVGPSGQGYRIDRDGGRVTVRSE